MESDDGGGVIVDVANTAAETEKMQKAEQMQSRSHTAAHDPSPASSSCSVSVSSYFESSVSLPVFSSSTLLSSGDHSSSSSGSSPGGHMDPTEQKEGKITNGSSAAPISHTTHVSAVSSLSSSAGGPSPYGLVGTGTGTASPRFYSPVDLPLVGNNRFYPVGIGTSIALPCCGVTLFRCPVCLAANLTKSNCCFNCQLFDLFQHELASHLTDHLYGRMQWHTGLFVVIPPASSRPNDPRHWTEVHIRAWLADTKQTSLHTTENLWKHVTNKWTELFKQKCGELDQSSIRSLSRSEFSDLSDQEFEQFHQHLLRLLDDRLEQGFDHTAMIHLPAVNPITLTAEQMRRLLDAKPLSPFSEEWIAVDAFKWLHSIGASVDDLLVLQELSSLPDGDPRNWSVWQWEAFLFPLRKRWNNLQYSANLQLLLYRLQWAYGEQMNPSLPYTTDVWYSGNTTIPQAMNYEDCCFGRIDKDRHIPPGERQYKGGDFPLTRSAEERAAYAALKPKPAQMSPTDIFSEAPWTAPFVLYAGEPTSKPNTFRATFAIPSTHLQRWTHWEVKCWFNSIGFNDIAHYLRENVDGAYFSNMELFEWVNVVDVSYGCCALTLSARMTLTRLIDWLRSQYQLPPMRWLLAREKCRTHGPQFLQNLREQHERAAAAGYAAALDPSNVNLTEVEQVLRHNQTMEQLQRDQNERAAAHMQFLQMQEQVQRHRKARRRASQHVQRILKEMQMNKVLEDAASELEGKKAHDSDSDEEKEEAVQEDIKEEKKESNAVDRFHAPPLPPAPAASNSSAPASSQMDTQCSLEGLGSPKVAPSISKDFDLLPSAASPSFAAQAKSLLGRSTVDALAIEGPAAAGLISPTTPKGTHRRRVSFNKSEFHKYFHREEETDRLYVLVHGENNSPPAADAASNIAPSDISTIPVPEPLVSIAVEPTAPSSVPAAVVSENVNIMPNSESECKMSDEPIPSSAPACKSAPHLPSLTVDPSLASFDTFTATPTVNTPTASTAAPGFSPSHGVAHEIVKSFSLVTSPTAREVALTPKGPLRSILKKRCHSTFAETGVQESTAAIASVPSTSINPSTAAVTFEQDTLPPAILPALMSAQDEKQAVTLPKANLPRNKRARGDYAIARAFELNASPAEMMALREMKVSAFSPAVASSGNAPAVERDETIKLNMQESGMSLSLQRLLCPEMFAVAPAAAAASSNPFQPSNSSASSVSSTRSVNFNNRASTEDISLSSSQDIDDYSSSDEEDEKKSDAMTD